MDAVERMQDDGLLQMAIHSYWSLTFRPWWPFALVFQLGIVACQVFWGGGWRTNRDPAYGLHNTV